MIKLVLSSIYLKQTLFCFSSRKNNKQTLLQNGCQDQEFTKPRIFDLTFILSGSSPRRSSRIGDREGVNNSRRVRSAQKPRPVNFPEDNRLQVGRHPRGHPVHRPTSGSTPRPDRRKATEPTDRRRVLGRRQGEHEQDGRHLGEVVRREENNVVKSTFTTTLTLTKYIFNLVIFLIFTKLYKKDSNIFMISEL